MTSTSMATFCLSLNDMTTYNAPMGFGGPKPAVAERRMRKRMIKTPAMEALTGCFRPIGVAIGSSELYRII